MFKKKRKNNHKNGKKPSFHHEFTLGERLADKIAEFGGSWTFIASLLIFLVLWMMFNVYAATRNFDPYPFILLNLFLSCLAALQAPIILMAQNRQADRDRIDSKYNYRVNRKAEREIQDVQRDLEKIMRAIKEIKRK